MKKKEGPFTLGASGGHPKGPTVTAPVRSVSFLTHERYSVVADFQSSYDFCDRLFRSRDERFHNTVTML